ncbi:MAG TPA: hypothetical protein VF938_03160 [Candidatus Angelobacter sp.]
MPKLVIARIEDRVIETVYPKPAFNYPIAQFSILLRDLSKLPPAMVSQLANMVEDYISSSRKKYAPQAVPLTGCVAPVGLRCE